MVKKTMITHYYQTVHGWFVQEKLFTSMVLSCNDIDMYHFVEIGSWKGKSSIFMGVEILNSGKKLSLIVLKLGKVRKNILMNLMYLMNHCLKFLMVFLMNF